MAIITGRRANGHVLRVTPAVTAPATVTPGWTALTLSTLDNIGSALAVAGPAPVLTLRSGIYQQVFNVPAGLDGFTIRSITGNPADVILDGQGGVTVAENLGGTGAHPLASRKGIAHCASAGTFIGISFVNGGSNAADGSDGQAGLYWDYAASSRKTAAAISCIFDHNQNGVFGNAANSNLDYVLDTCLFTRNGTTAGSHDTYLNGSGCTLTIMSCMAPGSNFGNDFKSRVAAVTVSGGWYGSQNANRWLDCADGATLTINGGTFVANDIGANVFANGEESTTVAAGNTTVNSATFYIGNRSADFANAGTFNARNCTVDWTSASGSITNSLGHVLTGLPSSPPGGTSYVSYPARPTYNYVKSAATQFIVSVSPASGTSGFISTVTYTPIGGAWPVGVVLTPTHTTINGTFSAGTLSPSGTAPAICTFTTSSAAVGTINATAPGMTSTGAATITATTGSGSFGGFPITFPGSAGAAPTGDAALTGSGFTVDGSTNLNLPSADYSFGLFTAPGLRADGNYDVTFKSTTPTRAVTLEFRASLDQSNFYEMVFDPSGTVSFYKVVNNGGGQFVGSQGVGVPSNATSVGVNVSGGTFTVRYNGANTAYSFSDTAITAGGYLGLGVWQTFGAVIASVNSTMPVSVATGVNLTISPSAPIVGALQTITVAPVGGVWGGSGPLTLSESGASGSLSTSSLTLPSGTIAPVTATFTSTGTGAGTLTASLSGLSDAHASFYINQVGGGATIESVSNMPTSATALQPMQQGVVIYSGIPLAYVCLYHNGADEGARYGFGGGQLPAFVAQDYPNGGTYTIRVYDAPSGGTSFYESGTITVAANPSQVGGNITFTWPSISSTAGVNQSVFTGGAGDGYVHSSAPMSDASVYLSSSNSVPPGVSNGSSFVVWSQLHVVDTSHSLQQMYIGAPKSPSAGTFYLWAIAVNQLDGSTTRAVVPTPIVVS